MNVDFFRSEKPGRKPIHGQAMTPAERKRAQREREAERQRQADAEAERARQAQAQRERETRQLAGRLIQALVNTNSLSGFDPQYPDAARYALKVADLLKAGERVMPNS